MSMCGLSKTVKLVITNLEDIKLYTSLSDTKTLLSFMFSEEKQ